MKLPVFAAFVPLLSCFAAVPEGVILQTADQARDVQLENGVAVRLSAHSAGTAYADHVVLSQGSARVGNFAAYSVNAAQLRIESETAGTEAVIRMQPSTIEIASIGGALKVTDGGALLTRVASGSRVSFQNPTQAPAKTGASPAPKKRSETKTFLWVMGGIAAAALAIGLTAAAQGKSPF